MYGYKILAQQSRFLNNHQFEIYIMFTIRTNVLSDWSFKSDENWRSMISNTS